MTRINDIMAYNAIKDSLLNTPVNKVEKVTKVSNFSKSLNKETDKYKQRNLTKDNKRGRR